MSTTYRWAPGARVKGKAQIVGEALADLQSEHDNRLTPRLVVDAARNIASPLHESFEWDDLRAAELHREQQARTIIASIRVVKAAQGTDTTDTLERVYVNVVEQHGDDEDRWYVPTVELKSRPDLFEQVRKALIEDLKRARSKVAEFDALLTVVDETIEAVTQALPLDV